jgi:hypothetical protein
MDGVLLLGPLLAWSVLAVFAAARGMAVWLVFALHLLVAYAYILVLVGGFGTEASLGRANQQVLAFMLPIAVVGVFACALGWWLRKAG